MDSGTTSPAGAGPVFAAPLAPTRVRVTGPLHGLRMPDACAACGTPARDTLRIEKMFRRTDGDSASRTIFSALDVPFCDACRAAHARELAPVDPAVLRKLRWQFVGRIIPYVFPIGVILWLFPKILLPLARELMKEGIGLRVASGQWNWGLLMSVGILAFFAFCLFGFLNLVNQARHHLTTSYAGDPNDAYVRREWLLLGRNAVIPGAPTSVLAAANFTDDESELFEPERRTYTFRDPVFAAQFAALNADRVWSGRSPRARWARRTRRWLFAALLVVGGLAILDDWTGGALWRAVMEYFP